MNILYIGPERDGGIIRAIESRVHADGSAIRHHVNGISELQFVNIVVMVGRPEPVFRDEEMYMAFMANAAAQGKVVAVSLDGMDFPYGNKFIDWSLNFDPRLSKSLTNAVVIPLEIYLRQI